jgi:hypothetical protein
MLADSEPVQVGAQAGPELVGPNGRQLELAVPIVLDPDV